MSIADFVLAFVGIIIGLGVADLLTSLHKLLRAGRRVRWHWATPSLAALMLFVTLVIWWWSFDWYSQVTSESIGAFLPRFLVLVLSFLMMAQLFQTKFRKVESTSGSTTLRLGSTYGR